MTLEVEQLPYYYVYIIRCKDSSYYTGHAKDVEKRFEMHKKGRGARYTRAHEPEELVYIEQFENRGEAMKRERKIKKLSHDRKQQLIIDNIKLVNVEKADADGNIPQG